MKPILDRDYTFVTNNRTDFLALYGRTQLHAGLVIVVPNVTPTLQRELFQLPRYSTSITALTSSCSPINRSAAQM